MTMRTIIPSALLVFAVAMPLTSAEAKPLFLCDNGATVLLTDQAGVNCPEYSSHAELITVPDGSTWRDVKWAVATQRPEAIEPRPQTTLSSQAVDACMEWQDINLRTDGGLDMETAENTRRWLALSRIITATNLCDEYLTRQIYPNF